MIGSLRWKTSIKNSILIPFEIQQKWDCTWLVLKFYFVSLSFCFLERVLWKKAPKGSSSIDNLTDDNLPLRNGEKKIMIKKQVFNKASWKCSFVFQILFFFFLPGWEQGFQQRDRSNCERKKKTWYKSAKVNDQMWREGLVYRNTVQFKIYKRFNATAWQSLKSTAQKTVTLRKILQL